MADLAQVRSAWTDALVSKAALARLSNDIPDTMPLHAVDLINAACRDIEHVVDLLANDLEMRLGHAPTPNGTQSIRVSIERIE